MKIKVNKHLILESFSEVLHRAALSQVAKNLRDSEKFFREDYSHKYVPSIVAGWNKLHKKQNQKQKKKPQIPESVQPQKTETKAQDVSVDLNPKKLVPKPNYSKTPNYHKSNYLDIKV